MAPETAEQTRSAAKRAAIPARQTKALIVDRACDLIAEGGLEALTAAALARQAGISKGGLYHHFERMDDVVFAAFDATSKRIFGVLGTGGPQTLSEYLDEVEHVVFKVLLKDPKSLRIITELYPKFMFDPSLRKARTASFARVSKSTSAASANGSAISEKQFEMAFSAISVFLTGLAVQNVDMRSVKQSRELWRWFREALNDKVMAG